MTNCELTHLFDFDDAADASMNLLTGRLLDCFWHQFDDEPWELQTLALEAAREKP